MRSQIIVTSTLLQLGLKNDRLVCTYFWTNLGRKVCLRRAEVRNTKDIEFPVNGPYWIKRYWLAKQYVELILHIVYKQDSFRVIYLQSLLAQFRSIQGYSELRFLWKSFFKELLPLYLFLAPAVMWT